MNASTLKKMCISIALIMVVITKAPAQETILQPVADLPAVLHENSSLIFTQKGLWTMNDGPATGLSHNNQNWQTEGIAYKTTDTLFISCEQTKDIDCQLYKVARKELIDN